MSEPTPVCAVIVTYHPDEAFATRLAAIDRQVAHTVIVDNGSPQETVGQLAALASTRVKLIANGENRGVAAALNQGLHEALARGFSWAVTFDQDSRPAEGMVAALLERGLRGVSRAAPVAAPVAVVGPAIVDENIPDVSYRFLRAHPRLPLLPQRVGSGESERGLENVTFVITSGALVNLAVFKLLGGYREDLFIDYVDTDYCLRAKRAGYRVAVSADATLFHHRGARRSVRRWGRIFRPTFYSPTRYYYLARNGVLTARAHALRFPHWFLFDLTATLNNFVRLSMEDDRRAKVRAALEGLRDGLRGRTGPRPG